MFRDKNEVKLVKIHSLEEFVRLFPNRSFKSIIGTT